MRAHPEPEALLVVGQAEGSSWEGGPTADTQTKGSQTPGLSPWRHVQG